MNGEQAKNVSDSKSCKTTTVEIESMSIGDANISRIVFGILDADNIADEAM